MVRKKGTLANIILQGKAQMVWTCGENEGNPGKHHLAEVKLRGFGHVVRKKGTLANIILQGKAQRVWT